MKISTIVAGLLVAGATFAFACGNMGGCAPMQGCDSKGLKWCDTKGAKNGCDMGAKGNTNCHKKFMRDFMDSVDTLSLTKEQEAKIQKIFDENPPKITNALDAFNTDKFDTQKFVDMMQNQKLEQIKHQADLVAKIYAILTPEQKAELRNDLKNGMMVMKGKFDTGIACRR